MLFRPPISDTRRLGRRGERAAARYLRKQGHRILARNVRLRAGEIDLVTLAPGGAIVMVEVKTRRDGSSIPPEASVTAAKKQTLLALTADLIRRNDWHDRAVRIDVVAVTWSPESRTPDIRHYEHAVTPSTGVRRASRGRRPRA